MEHRLSRARAHIHNGPVSLLDIALAGDLGRRQVAASDHFGVLRLRFLQSSKMLPRDDQHMSRRFRIDVFKSKDILVLINLLGGNLAAENSAEQATARRVGACHGENITPDREIVTQERRGCNRPGASNMSCRLHVRQRNVRQVEIPIEELEFGWIPFRR
jgi:hypothetical protein